MKGLAYDEDSLIYFQSCISQLKISHPNHTLVERAAAGEASFDRAVQSVA